MYSKKYMQFIPEPDSETETPSDSSDEEYIPPSKKTTTRKTRKEPKKTEEEHKEEELSDPVIIDEESHEEQHNEEEPTEPQSSQIHPLSNQNTQVPQTLIPQNHINPLTPLNAIPLDTLIPGSQVYKYVAQSLKNVRFPALYVHEVMYLQQYYQITSQIPQSIKLMIEENQQPDSFLPKSLSLLLHNLMLQLSSIKRQFKHIQHTDEFQSNPDVQRREFNIYAKEMFKCKYNMWNTFFSGNIPDEFNEAKQYHLSVQCDGELGPTGNDGGENSEYLETLYKKLPKGLRLYIPRYACRSVRFE